MHGRARQGGSVGRRGASPTPHCRHTPQKATIIGRALDVPVGSSSSAAGGISSSAGGGSSVAGAAVGHSSVTPWRITRVGASPVQVCLPRWCQACTPGQRCLSQSLLRLVHFRYPRKGPLEAAGAMRSSSALSVSCMGTRGGACSHMTTQPLAFHTPAVATLARPRRVPSALAFGDPRAFSLMALPAPGRTRAWAHEQQQQQLEERCGG